MSVIPLYHPYILEDTAHELWVLASCLKLFGQPFQLSRFLAREDQIAIMNVCGNLIHPGLIILHGRYLGWARAIGH